MVRRGVRDLGQVFLTIEEALWKSKNPRLRGEEGLRANQGRLLNGEAGDLRLSEASLDGEASDPSGSGHPPQG